MRQAEDKLGATLGIDGILGMVNDKGENIPTFMVPIWRSLKNQNRYFAAKQWNMFYNEFDLHSVTMAVVKTRSKATPSHRLSTQS